MKRVRLLYPLLFLWPALSLLSAVQKKAPPVEENLVLTFVGDIMANPRMTEALSRDKAALEPIKPYLDGGLNFANLEFTVNTNKPAMGYPNFNGTREYLGYFKNYFNIFSVANNHVYDHGAKSQAETLSYLEEEGILYVGGGTNSVYTPALRTNIKGVRLFFNAYSMVDNGLYFRSTNTASRYYMNYFSEGADAARALAKELEGVPGETLKIVSLHFGAEYKAIPTEAEKSLPKMLIEAGADIVVGHHPHCPRPVEWYQGKKHSGVILYSLGNFYTPHKNSYLYLDAGTVVRLKVNAKKEYSFSYIPTFTYFFNSGAGERSRVLALERSPEEALPLSKEFGLEYAFSAPDIKHIKEAYSIVHEFYAPLKDIKAGLTN